MVANWICVCLCIAILALLLYEYVDNVHEPRTNGNTTPFNSPIQTETPASEKILQVRVINVEDLWSVHIITDYEFVNIYADSGNLIIDGDVKRTIELSDKPIQIYNKAMLHSSIILDIMPL